MTEFCDHEFNPGPGPTGADQIPLHCDLPYRHPGYFHTDGIRAFVTPPGRFAYAVSPGEDPGARLRSAVAEVDRHLEALLPHQSGAALQAKAHLLVALATVDAKPHT